MTKPWWTRALLGRTAVSNPLQDDEGPDPQFEMQWRPLVKKRLVTIFAILAVWVLVLEGRLVWIQVVKHDDWAKRAKGQQEGTEKIEAPRGPIRDRNGRLLAYSVTSYELHVNPRKIKESPAADAFGRDSVVFAHLLCAALDDCAPGEESAIVAKLDKPKGDVLIRRAQLMTPDAVAGVRAFAELLAKKNKKQDFVSLEPGDVRFYPNNRLAAQVIGFANIEGVGVNGVEAQFDSVLRGTPGTLLKQQDALDNPILTSVLSPPKPGASIELTIDLALQEITERELRKGVDDAGALGGTALMLDSTTGEVLAMSSLPTYNLNLPGQAVPDDERNRAIQDLYEPGSTFKIVTLSAALNEGIVTPDSVFDTNPGWMTVEGRSKPIKEDRGHNYGVLTLQGILVKSSNIGAAQVGMRLGPDQLLRYANAFGLGRQDVARDFFSERIGKINVPRGGLSKASLAVVSYGYQVNANPLQIATAMNVFATGGLLMRPRLVRATVDGDVRRVTEPEVVGRVVTPETAAAMVTMLEAVVREGTGTTAAIERYRVAGKTGTTKKVLSTGYSESDYLVSFVGFAPSRNPRFTIIVVIDRPTKLPAYGSVVSAPVFKRIAEASLNFVGEQPSVDPAPAVVTDERPVSRPPRPAVSTPVLVNAGGVQTMPDLTGLTLRDALRRLPPGLTINAQGDGVVVSQSPAAGETVTTDRGILKLQREPAKAGGGSR